MIEAFLVEETNKQINEELQSLEKLKEKMEAIKKSAVIKHQETLLISHDHAIHSGDYYMFQDEDEKLNSRQLEIGGSKLHKVEIETNNSTLKESIKTFIHEVLVVLVRHMQKLSRNYRFILRIMSQEKMFLKEAILPGSLDRNDAV